MNQRTHEPTKTRNPRTTRAAGGALGFAVMLVAVASLSGCLGEPRLEDRWTRIDFADPQPERAITPGSATAVSLRGRITFRSILTGHLIAEIRVSDTIGYGDVNLDPELPREDLRRDVELILANSVSAGVTGVPVTGWDRLIREIDLAWTADIPADPGAGGVFLLLYFGDAEEVDLPGGGEITIYTPADFSDLEILPIGLELVPAAGQAR